jgi:lysosomal Pro-X carboxypeptidase
VINVPLDHFHNWGKQTQTLQLRYLIDFTHFDDDFGCILFYAGGYKDVWSYYNKSGFVTQTLAQQLKALVVFGEHRYFGASVPLNTSSHVSQEDENFKYLSVD